MFRKFILKTKKISRYFSLNFFRCVERVKNIYCFVTYIIESYVIFYFSAMQKEVKITDITWKRYYMIYKIHGFTM